MNWWDAWISLLQNSLQVISVTGGLGTGFSIIVLTVIARIVLLPLSWSCAYESRIRRLRLERLKPELERLRQRHQGDGQAAPSGTGYTIKIKEKGTFVADISDAPFTIKGIDSVSPNSSESWVIGSTRNAAFSMTSGLLSNRVTPNNR